MHLRKLNPGIKNRVASRQQARTETRSTYLLKSNTLFPIEIPSRSNPDRAHRIQSGPSQDRIQIGPIKSRYNPERAPSTQKRAHRIKIESRIQIGPAQSVHVHSNTCSSQSRYPPTPPPQEFRLKPYVRAALTTWASAAALRSAIVMWGPEWDPTECMDPRRVPVEPSGIKGYFAMSVVDAAKVRRLEVLSSNSASITDKNNAPTPFIPFQDEAHNAVKAAEQVFMENNEWMVVEVKFTPMQVFKLFVSNRICRTEGVQENGVPKYGFRVYHADAADADAGLDLTEHDRMWLKTVGDMVDARRALVDAGATWGRSPDDDDMGDNTCPASASDMGGNT